MVDPVVAVMPMAVRVDVEDVEGVAWVEAAAECRASAAAIPTAPAMLAPRVAWRAFAAG